MFGILLEMGVLMSLVYLDLGKYNSSLPVATNFWLVPSLCLKRDTCFSFMGDKNRNICHVLDVKKVLSKTSCG
jgi:hypothetical protein